MDERRPLSDEILLVQAEDFGPRMILLGAAGMLKRLGHQAHFAYADRFIAHVMDRHYDEAAGLLRNVPGEDQCNVGHGIEFVGFALDYLGAMPMPSLSLGWSAFWSRPSTRASSVRALRSRFRLRPARCRVPLPLVVAAGNHPRSGAGASADRQCRVSAGVEYRPRRLLPALLARHAADRLSDHDIRWSCRFCASHAGSRSRLSYRSQPARRD